MDIRLTDAEMYVVATTLEAEVPDAVRQQNVEAEELWQAGIKSLLARYLIRRVGEADYVLDAELSKFCGSLLASHAFVALLAENGDGAIVSTFLLESPEVVYSLAPVAEGVWQLATAVPADVAAMACELSLAIGPVAAEFVQNETHSGTHNVTADDELFALDGREARARVEVESALTQLVAEAAVA